MFIPFATIMSFQSMFVLGLVGLLIFGKDLPLMARQLMKEYFRYKKMISDATADIQREMDSAANILEDEKRRLEHEARSMGDEFNTDKILNSKGATPSADTAGAENGTNSAALSNGTEHTEEPPRASEPPPKPAADPLSLDIPAPSGLSHRATEPAKSPAAQAAALDTYQKSVPPPSKIPPPLG